MVPVAFDTETHLIEPGRLAPSIVCLSVADGTDTDLFHHTEAQSCVRFMLESDRILVGHNVAFDMACIVTMWPDLLPLVFEAYDNDRVTDTMLRQKLLDIASSRRRRWSWSLAECVKRHFGIVLKKADTYRLRYGELSDVPLYWWPEEAQEYAKDDALYTLRVWHSQQERDKYLADEFRQARAAFWLHLMSVHGLTTDPVAVEALAERLQIQHDDLKARLVEAGLMRKNGTRNTKAAAQRMVQQCAHKGLGVVLTPTGRPKLDRDACLATEDSILRAYSDISSVKKTLSTDIALLRKGLIQVRWNSILESGRTSSSPNIQNPPRKGGVRECYVPQKGWLFAVADFDQFELRAVAQVCITALGVTSKLADALNAGRDPHTQIAGQLAGCSYDEASILYREGDSGMDGFRQLGKIANFGFWGGMGITAFVQQARSMWGVILTESQARELKQAWFLAWPEAREFFAWISQQCENGPAQIKQLFVERYRGGCHYTEACNTEFQGLAADAAKEAGWRIAKACYLGPSILQGSRPVNFLHDEFMIEVLDDPHASDKADEMVRLMCEGANAYLPDIPAKASACLTYRFSKDAKTTRDDQGKLIPWNTQ